jgi:serine/threonine-protein kinase TTK/MPS1
MKSSSPSSSSSSASVSASGADLAGTSAAAAAAAAARRTLRPIVPHAVTIPTAVPASAALTVPHTAAAPAATAAAAASEDSGLFARHPHGEYLHVNGIRYLVVQEIGFGGSSRVYKVADAAGRQLALKKISLTPESRGHVANYEAEIRMLGKLRHQPHAIQLIDSQVPGTGTSVGTATCGGEDAIYMLFEFGTMDVAHLIKHPAQAAGAGGRRAAVGADGKVIGLSREQVRFFWREMALCVDMCHHNDIIHLDLKPSNFVLVDGRLKIIDFGIAKEIEEDATSVVRDSPVGTLNYMSPESILGMMSTTDARAAPLYKLNQSADVWSLGCMLYQMVYGKAPFAHVRSEFRLSAITNPAVKIEFPALPAHLTATLAGDDDALFNVLARCLNRDPKARITMTELLTHPFVLGRPGGPLAVTSQAVCEALARAELPGAPPAAARVLATLPLADRADFASWLRETLTDVIYGEK